MIWAKNKTMLEFNPTYIKQKLFDRIKSYETEGKELEIYFYYDQARWQRSYKDR